VRFEGDVGGFTGLGAQSVENFTGYCALQTLESQPFTANFIIVCLSLSLSLSDCLVAKKMQERKRQQIFEFYKSFISFSFSSTKRGFKGL
jgi:hypothetical protein